MKDFYVLIISMVSLFGCGGPDNPPRPSPSPVPSIVDCETSYTKDGFPNGCTEGTEGKTCNDAGDVCKPYVGEFRGRPGYILCGCGGAPSAIPSPTTTLHGLKGEL